MSADPETLRVYRQRADDYAAMAGDGSAEAGLAAFISALPRGARVLDLGCGPGHAAAAMARAGLVAEAVDAAPEMVALAAGHAGVTARLATFDDIDGTAIHDGIWAGFSLLHARRAELPRHLAALRRALKPGGLFHIGMKTGTGTHRDGLGRLYSYYTAAELDGLLRGAGFSPFSSHSGSSRGLDGKVAPWVTMAAHA